MKKDSIIAIVVLFFLTIIAILFFTNRNIKIGKINSGKNVISVVYIEGTIGNDTLSSDIVTSEQVKLLLEEVKRENPKGVVIRIDSPGGLVTETEEIYSTIKKFKSETKLKVYVSMGSVAASGGYYISCAADRIFAMNSTITGSIGVIIELLNYEELLDKIGIKEFVFKSGAYKDMGSPYRSLTSKDEEIFKNIVDKEYQMFLDVIHNERKISKEDLRNIAQGQIFLGIDAKNEKLIDEIGFLEDVINNMASDIGIEGNFIVSEHRVRKSIISSIFSLFHPELDIIRNANTFKVEYKMSY